MTILLICDKCGNSDEFKMWESLHAEAVFAQCQECNHIYSWRNT